MRAKSTYVFKFKCIFDVHCTHCIVTVDVIRVWKRRPNTEATSRNRKKKRINCNVKVFLLNVVYCYCYVRHTLVTVWRSVMCEYSGISTCKCKWINWIFFYFDLIKWNCMIFFSAFRLGTPGHSYIIHFNEERNDISNLSEAWRILRNFIATFWIETSFNISQWQKITFSLVNTQSAHKSFGFFFLFCSPQ